jgi:hypothetical protein
MDEALYIPVNPLLKLLYKPYIAQMGYVSLCNIMSMVYFSHRLKNTSLAYKACLLARVFRLDKRPALRTPFLVLFP